jgi:hypothetical protein
VACFVALALTAALPSIAQESDVESGEVITSANVLVAGSPPTLECLWLLPDDGGDPGDGMQYLDDDDPATTPAPVPCDDPVTGQAPGARHLIQVRPNVDDLPGPRLLETWISLSHPYGTGAIDAASWRVYHPDGTLATMVDGDLVDGAACANLGATPGSSALTTGSMFAAAHATGQLGNAAIADPNTGIVAGCQDGTRILARGTFDLSRFQPCGEYRLAVDAMSDGDVATLDGYFDVLCFHQLQLDFSAVEFGMLQPGVPKTLAGDSVFGSSPPTVRNGGNGGFDLGIEITPLREQVAAGGSTIDDFAAAFGLDSNNLEWIDPLPVDFATWFSPADPQTVCPGDEMPLHLTIRPTSTIPSGVYTGSIVILAMPDVALPDAIDPLLFTYTCNNDNGTWDAADPGAQR